MVRPAVNVNSKLFAICGVLLILAAGTPGGYRIDDARDAVAYLERFGYLEEPGIPADGVSVTEFEEAVKEFQNFSHLRPSGLMNPGTLKLMNSPRCGNRDENMAFSDEVDFGRRATKMHQRSRRSTKPVKKWKKSVLSYAIVKFPNGSRPKLNARTVQNEIDMAFKYWERVTNLRFRKATRKQADITIWFLRGDHGDQESFDGPGKTLAHGFYPRKGAVHFDDEERWSIGFRWNHFDLRTVAVHEIGHAIGVTHVPNPQAVMFFKYEGHRSRSEDFKLHHDDITAVQALYGPKREQTQSSKSSIRHSSTDPPDLCVDPKVDAITTMSDGITYALKGSYYFPAFWQGGKFSLQEPRLITQTFFGLPHNLDAAFSTNDGKTYFFKGSLFWRSTGTRMDTGYPKPIRKHFRGIPNKPNAALVWSWNDKVYLFKGDKYWRLENSTALIDYPKKIEAHWPGIPNNIDAAFKAPDNRTYIFKGNKYWMFHDPSSAFEARSYPKQAYRLFGCHGNNRAVLTNEIPLGSRL